MATHTKPQKFPYSYKTVSIPVNSQFVFNKPYMEIINPLNLFEVELLYTHIRIIFAAAIPSQYQKLLNVTVTGLDANGNVVRAAKGVTLNKSAVGNIVDAVVDLTPYIYKPGRNQIGFEVASADPVNGTIPGTEILQIWKSDMAYTVKGIS